ncbi:type VII secretion protein EccCa [Kitasatospora sp. NPDC006697]|uniref:type VII secretion protein EccCa n=1 Tax=Kitasatospora sp. NPDC006697 TaxID=3364020 RepID=UPI0036C579F9
MPAAEIQLEQPPPRPRVTLRAAVLRGLTLLGALGSAGLALAPGAPPGLRLTGAAALLLSLAAAVHQLRRSRAERREYRRHLAIAERRLSQSEELQRSAALFLHPAPDQLWSLVAEHRLWERARTDEDFGCLRIGTGRQRPRARLVLPQLLADRVGALDRRCLRDLRRLAAEHDELDGLPISLSLRAYPRITVDGDPAEARGLVRALLAQLATHHSPSEMLLAVVAPQQWSWTWAEWLPHTSPPAGGGPALILPDFDALERRLAGELADRREFDRSTPADRGRRQLLVVADGAAPPEDPAGPWHGGLNDVTLLEIAPRTPAPVPPGLRLTVRDGGLRLHSGDFSRSGRADRLEAEQAEALARRLALFRPESGPFGAGPATAPDFAELLGAEELLRGPQPREPWQPGPPADRLRVPIGTTGSGEPVRLDLREAALGGTGLCVGAEGSGKSELLLTLVAALALTHSPEEITFVLADFTGGDTFLPVAGLPHVVGLLSGLPGQLRKLERFREAIDGELDRRQQLLREAGNLRSHTDYQRRREQQPTLPPLPVLLVAADEVGELLAARPEMRAAFERIARTGPALGVRLLLTARRMAAGALRELDHLVAYRIALRTRTPAGSRAVIGTPDAYDLRGEPGSGYLRVGSALPVRFQAAHAGAPDRAAPERTVLDLVAARLSGHRPAARRIPLPPLTTSSLDGLLGPLSATPERGLAPLGWNGPGALAVPVALMDDPRGQRQEEMWLDFAGPGGHALVVGAPGSGKTTLLRTLTTAFALTHTPAETRFGLLDFDGGGLAALRGLPHVGAVAARTDAEQVRRTVSEVHALLDRRAEAFRTRAIDGIRDFRARRAAGQLPGERSGDHFLVIDGWLGFQQEHPELEPLIEEIARRGLGYGVHLVIAATRYAHLRPGLRELLCNRTELRLAEAAESQVDAAAALSVPAKAPGRGLSRGGLHFRTALPRIDGSTGTADLAAGLADLVGRSAAAWAATATRPPRSGAD